MKHSKLFICRLQKETVNKDQKPLFSLTSTFSQTPKAKPVVAAVLDFTLCNIHTFLYKSRLEMKMIQKWGKKWGRPTDFNAKKLKSAYFSPATQTVLQAVNMQFGLDSLVLLLVSSS